MALPSREITDSTIDPMHGGCDRPDRPTRCRSSGTNWQCCSVEMGFAGHRIGRIGRYLGLPNRFSGQTAIGSCVPIDSWSVPVWYDIRAVPRRLILFVPDWHSSQRSPPFAGERGIQPEKHSGGPNIDQCVRFGARRSPFRRCSAANSTQGTAARGPVWVVAAAVHGVDGRICDFS